MTNAEAQMSNQAQGSNDKNYNLAERTALFGESIIDFAKSLHKDEITRSLISQLVRAGTSIGANYMEADGADSKKDFRHKIGLCKRESKETMHWLRMVTRAAPNTADTARALWKEAHELVLIFSSIINNSKK